MYHSGYEKYESSSGLLFFSPISAAGFFALNELGGSGPASGFTKAHFSQNTATNRTNAPRQIRMNGRTLRFRKRFSFSRISAFRGSGAQAAAVLRLTLAAIRNAAMKIRMCGRLTRMLVFKVTWFRCEIK